MVSCMLSEDFSCCCYCCVNKLNVHTHSGFHPVELQNHASTMCLTHPTQHQFFLFVLIMIQKFIWLQAFAQVPDLHVWYGPDSYMGANLAQLFTSLAFASDAEVQALHPGHTAASVRSLLPRLHHFTEGICIVHHMFGSEVTDLVKSAYPDAYLAAHFEVRDNLLALWLIGAICVFLFGESIQVRAVGLDDVSCGPAFCHQFSGI